MVVFSQIVSSDLCRFAFDTLKEKLRIQISLLYLRNYLIKDIRECAKHIFYIFLNNLF